MERREAGGTEQFILSCYSRQSGQEEGRRRRTARGVGRRLIRDEGGERRRGEVQAEELNVRLSDVHSAVRHLDRSSQVPV